MFHVRESGVMVSTPLNTTIWYIVVMSLSNTGSKGKSRSTSSRASKKATPAKSKATPKSASKATSKAPKTAAPKRRSKKAEAAEAAELAAIAAAQAEAAETAAAQTVKTSAPKRGRPKKTEVVDPFASAGDAPASEVPADSTASSSSRTLPKAADIETVRVRRKVKPTDLQEDLEVLRSNLAQLEQIVSSGQVSSSSGLSVSRRLLRYADKNLDKISKNVANVKTTRSKKNGKSSGPTGLHMQYVVSAELADFMGLDDDETASRADAGRAFCKYVKDNDLQDPEHRRIIHPDDAILSILRYNPSTDGPITFSTYTKFIQHHFLEPVSQA